MGRDHRNVAVVIGFDAAEIMIKEDIIPLDSYRISGSILLNVPVYRRTQQVRFIAVRLFDDAGKRIEIFGKCYGLDGHEVSGLHRRPDGSIIEHLPWE
jgi:hypothetical protein